MVTICLLGAVLVDPVSRSKSFGEEDTKQGKQQGIKSKRDQVKKGDDQKNQDNQLRSRILGQLGEKEEGHFLLILKKTAIQRIVTIAPTPRGARRLGNKWEEVIYQVELIEGRQNTADYLLAYIAFTKSASASADEIKETFEVAYDWKLVSRYENLEEAERQRAKAILTANQRSVTRLPKTPRGLKFYRPVIRTNRPRRR